ncbi:hypothetical protein OG422_08280 [Streptomyces sp. NBC_01525]
MGVETNWAMLLPTLAAEQWLDTLDHAPAIEWASTAPTRAGGR